LQQFECIQSNTDQSLYIIVDNHELVASDGSAITLETPWFKTPRFDGDPRLVPSDQLSSMQIEAFKARISTLDEADGQSASQPVPAFWTGRKYTTDDIHGPLNGGPIQGIFVRNRGRVVGCKFIPRQNPHCDNFEFWIPSDALYWLQTWQSSDQAVPVFVMEASPRQWRCTGWCVVDQTIWEGPALEKARKKFEKATKSASRDVTIGCIIKVRRIPERDMSPALKHIS